jgi:adenylate kinase family enzyme
MKIIFIHGPAASGKHTIGTILSETLNIPLFHNHLVVDAAKALFNFGDPGFINIRDKMWRVCFFEAAKAQKSFIFTFNPERTVSKDLIDSIVSNYQNQGGEIFYIELTCPDQEILKRIGNESRRKFGKLTDAEIFKTFKADGGFEFPDFPDPIISINTAIHSPKESADIIVNALSDRDRTPHH